MSRPAAFSLVMTSEDLGLVSCTQMAGSSAVSPTTPVGTVSRVDGTSTVPSGTAHAGAATATSAPTATPTHQRIPMGTTVLT